MLAWNFQGIVAASRQSAADCALRECGALTRRRYRGLKYAV